MRGAFGALDVDLPLEALVTVESPGSEAAELLGFGLIVGEARRRMTPLLAPTWFPRVAQVPNAVAGTVEGLRPTFEVRHEDAHWPDSLRLGHVLGILPDLRMHPAAGGDALCMVCEGGGRRATVDAATLVPDAALSIEDGAIAPWAKKKASFHIGVLTSLAPTIGLDLAAPWNSLGKAVRAAVLYGLADSNFKGVVHDVERRLARVGEGRGGESMDSLMSYVRWAECSMCEGTGLSAQAQVREVGGIRLSELYRMTPATLRENDERELCALRVDPETIAAAVALGLGDVALGSITGELGAALAGQLRLAQVLTSGLKHALYVVAAPHAELGESVCASTAAYLVRRSSLGDSLLVVGESRECSEASAERVVLKGDAALRSVTRL